MLPILCGSKPRLDAVENRIVGRGLKKTRRTEERLQMLRVRAAGGNGALPIVGDPNEATMMKRLSEWGISALAMGFTNYLEHFLYFRDEVLPRLVHEALRAG